MFTIVQQQTIPLKYKKYVNCVPTEPGLYFFKSDAEKNGLVCNRRSDIVSVGDDLRTLIRMDNFKRTIFHREYDLQAAIKKGDFDLAKKIHDTPFVMWFAGPFEEPTEYES
jgi:hypothetical protein